MLFVLLPSLQFTDDISSKHTHLFQIRGKDTTFLSQISGNSVKVCCKSGATRHIIVVVPQRCVTFIFLYGLPPKPRAAIVWSLIINLPARKSYHTWWYSLCLEIAITRQLVSKTIFITIRYEILWSSEITQSTNSAYYPFLRLSSKKLINSSEILEISPLS